MSSKKKSDGYTAEEKAAMKERARELKAEERAGKDREAGEKAILDKIAEMNGLDRTMGERIHAIVKASTPELMPKTWYGMPAYANKDGKIICFFQPAEKFGTRYATFGFNEDAKLDDGELWPVPYAFQDLIVRGPYQRVLGIQTVHPTDSDNFDPSFSFTIPKNPPVGTITTVMVSLFESTYDNTGARAVGAKGISIAK